MLVYKAYIAAEFEELNPLYNLDSIRDCGYDKYIDKLLFVDELVEPTDESNLKLAKEQPEIAYIIDDHLMSFRIAVYVDADDNEEPPVYMYVNADEFNDL